MFTGVSQSESTSETLPHLKNTGTNKNNSSFDDKCDINVLVFVGQRADSFHFDYNAPVDQVLYRFHVTVAEGIKDFRKRRLTRDWRSKLISVFMKDIDINRDDRYISVETFQTVVDKWRHFIKDSDPLSSDWFIYARHHSLLRTVSVIAIIRESESNALLFPHLPSSQRFPPFSSSLRYIDLSYFNLYTLPDAIKSCSTLSNLSLAYNPGISDSLDESLFQSLKNLQHLDLSGCGLTRFPPTNNNTPPNFTLNSNSDNNQWCSSLRALILRDNKITSFQVEFFPNLHLLDIAANPIESFSIHPFDGKTHPLKELSCSDSMLQLMPSLKQFPEMKLLHFIRNNQNSDSNNNHGNSNIIDQMELGYLSSLHSLDLKDNHLDRIPVHLVRCKSLRKLILRNNNLSSRHDWEILSRLSSNLEMLDLSYNSVGTSELKKISTLKHLRHLFLRNCGITTLPIQFKNLTSLQSLDLSANPELFIRTLGGSNSTSSLQRNTSRQFTLSSTKSLTSMSTKNTQDIDYPFSSHSKEKNSNSPLASGSPSSSSYKSSNLNNSSTTVMDESGFNVVWKIEYLRELRIDENDIGEISNEIRLLKNLRVLTVANNNLNTLPLNLHLCFKIEVLDISNNCFEEFPIGIRRLRKLRELYISGNSIRQVDGKIFEQNSSSLIKFEAVGNQLSSVPSQMCYCRMLSCKFDDNPMQPEFGSSQTTKRGRMEQLFPLMRDDQVAPENRVKVYLVGHGFSGKTSLIHTINRKSKWNIGEWKLKMDSPKTRSIDSDEFTPNSEGTDPFDFAKRYSHDTTDSFTDSEDGDNSSPGSVGGRTMGVEIYEQSTKMKNLNIELTFWDFGGQMEYYVTHEFFWTYTNTIYMVVIDMSKGIDRFERQLRYWTKFINVKIDAQNNHRVPVFVIGSHNDQLSQSKKNNVNTIQSQIATIIEDITEEFSVFEFHQFFVDCRSRKSIKELKKVMKQSAYDLVKHIRISTAFRTIRDHVHELRKMRRIMSKSTLIENLRDQCHESIGAATGLYERALRYLHDIGDIVYLPGSRYVVLDMVWLCKDVFGTIFCPSEMSKIVNFSIKNGKVTRSMLKECFGDDINALISILKQFRLCVDIDSETLLFPSLLSGDAEPQLRMMPLNSSDEIENSSDHSDHVLIGRRLSFNPSTVIPEGFFPRLQVMLYNELSGAIRLWNGGFIFTHRISDVKFRILSIVSRESMRIDFIIKIMNANSKRGRIPQIWNWLQSLVLAAMEEYEGLVQRSSNCFTSSTSSSSASLSLRWNDSYMETTNSSSHNNNNNNNNKSSLDQWQELSNAIPSVKSSVSFSVVKESIAAQDNNRSSSPDSFLPASTMPYLHNITAEYLCPSCLFSEQPHQAHGFRTILTFDSLCKGSNLFSCPVGHNVEGWEMVFGIPFTPSPVISEQPSWVYVGRRFKIDTWTPLSRSLSERSVPSLPLDKMEAGSSSNSNSKENEYQRLFYRLQFELLNSDSWDISIASRSLISLSNLSSYGSSSSSPSPSHSTDRSEAYITLSPSGGVDIILRYQPRRNRRISSDIILSFLFRIKSVVYDMFAITAPHAPVQEYALCPSCLRRQLIPYTSPIEEFPLNQFFAQPKNNNNNMKMNKNENNNNNNTDNISNNNNNNNNSNNHHHYNGINIDLSSRIQSCHQHQKIFFTAEMLCGEVMDYKLEFPMALTPRLSGQPWAIGRYDVQCRFDQEIGRGTSGTVFYGMFRDRPAAIKQIFLSEEQQNDGSDWDIVRRECETLHVVQHRNTLRFFGACLEGNELLIVTEYAPHGSLRQLLDSDRELSFKDKLSIISDIMHGLEALHNNHVIHRDIKPENFLIFDGGVVKIADFGLAKIRQAPSSLPGNIKGTPVYMAPETSQNGPTTAAADIFSAAFVMWEILFRAPLFPDAVDPFAVLMQVADGMRPSAVRGLHDDPERALWEVIQSCWQEDPQRRPSASDVIRSLSCLKVGSS